MFAKYQPDSVMDVWTKDLQRESQDLAIIYSQYS